MINEEQYKQVCKVCNELLILPDSTIERVAIPWLHVIREHPIILDRYNPLFSAESISRKIKKYILNTGLWYKQLLRSYNSNGKNWFTSSDLPRQVDFLFISHLLNRNQINQKGDFYFGNLPGDQLNEGRSVVIASLVHCKFDYSWFEENHINDELPRIFFSDTVRRDTEVEIHQRAGKEADILRKLASNESDPFVKKVMYVASEEAMSGATHITLRLTYQINELLARLHPKVIVSTYEGHAYERVIFATARKFDSTIKCISYQHTGVFRLSNAIRQSLKAEYNPDLILTSGIDGKEELQNSLELKGIPIKVLGSIRGDVADSDVLVNNYEKCCLVIPEGFRSECYVLFSFSLQCALQRPDIDFIWRLHPSITFKELKYKYSEFNNLPPNISLSKRGLEEDILNSAWVLYRGSTAIFKAISQGLRPIYLQKKNEISIDPLYKMNEWQCSISDFSDFFFYINLDVESDFQNQRDNIYMAKRFCENHFAKIDVEVLNKSLSNPKVIV